MVGDEGDRDDQDLLDALFRQRGQVVDGGRLEPFHRADLALVAERPRLVFRQPLQHALDCLFDLALVWVAPPDEALRHPVRAEKYVNLFRFFEASQGLADGAGQRVEVLGVFRIAVDLGERHGAVHALAQVVEGRLGRRRAPLRIEGHADELLAAVGARLFDRVLDVRPPRRERDVALVTWPQLFLEPPPLRLGERPDRRPSPDLRIQLPRVRRPPSRHPPGKPPPQKSPQKRNPDQKRIEEEIHQVRLNRLQRIRPAKIEQQDARVRRNTSRLDRNWGHPGGTL